MKISKQPLLRTLLPGAVILAFCALCMPSTAHAANEAEEFLDRLERVEEYLGRHGFGQHLPYYRDLRQRAAELDLPVAEARVRLVLGRSLLDEAGMAHLELAAETFATHGEQAWEALARLQIGRQLYQQQVAAHLWNSTFRDEAVSSLRAAIRLAEEAEDPMTAAEAQWLLASIHRIEGAYGPAVDHYERAVESLERAELPLVSTVGGIRLAEIYRTVGQERDAIAVLESRLGKIEKLAGFEDLETLAESRPEPPSNLETAEQMKRVADRLARRGFPDLAAHYYRVAEFFAERTGRERPGVISAEDREEMAALQIRARKERREKLPRWDPRGTPLVEFMEEHSDSAFVQRVLEIALRREIEGTERQIRRRRLNRRLSGEEVANATHATFLERARETGEMPEIPVEWMVEQLKQAPESYRGKLGGLSQWVEERAADLYAWLTRRVEGGIRLPDEIDRSDSYRQVNAWQKRYCENLNTAFRGYGAPDEYSCNLRPSIRRLADDLARPTSSSLPAVSESTGTAVLEDQKRRLEGLLADPSRLEEEIEAGELDEFFDLLLFDARNPGFSETTAFARPQEVIAVREVSEELVPAELRERARRRGEIECALAQQLTLHQWITDLYAAEAVRHRAEEHRAWSRNFQERLRERFPPKGHVQVGSSEWEPVWGVGCGEVPNPTFLDLRTIDPASARQDPGRDGPLVAAFADLEAGRHQEAARALEAYAEADVDRPQIRALVLSGLGRAYLALGKTENARDAFESAVEALESILGSFRSPRRLAAYSESLSDTYGRLIGLLVDEGRTKAAFEVAERARARAFLHRLGGRRVDPAVIRPAGDGVEQLRRAQHELRSRIVLLETLREHPELVSEPDPEAGTGTTLTPAKIEKELELARRTYVRGAERIERTDPAYATLATGSVAGIDEIQRDLLPEGVVLLEYYLLPDRAVAWVVDRRSVWLVELPMETKTIAGWVDLLGRQIANRGAYEATAAELHRGLIAPVAPLLDGRPVVIVPHGPLHLLPFAALRDGQGGAPLTERLTWTSIPSASALRFLSKEGWKAPSHPVVVGSPDGSLPSARQEARAVAEMFGAEALLGERASEAAVRERLPEADLLHFAAHAVFTQSDPMFSRIELAPSARRSGDGTDDGKLEVLEIHNLDLRNLELVTLSACKSAVGGGTGGDNVTSLQRSFLASGVGHVVSTLWSVEDEATAAWSEAFYRRLKNGEPVAAALRGAQNEIRADERWDHPYFWAGFVASGLPAGR